MGVDDFVVSGSINLIIAQRLVRKVCDNCKSKEKLDKVILKKIGERSDAMKSLEAKQKGLSETISEETFAIGKGCEKCYNTGYSGRVGIYEVMSPSKEIHDAVLSHKSAEQIENIALKQGFENMISDGINKVLDGKTTFEEILRTTRNV